MTTLIILIIPFLLLALSLTRVRVVALVLLSIYSAVMIFLLTKTGLTTISSVLGLIAAIALLIYASINGTIKIFLIIEGRTRRKGSFEELLGRYDR